MRLNNQGCCSSSEDGLEVVEPKYFFTEGVESQEQQAYRKCNFNQVLV